MNVAELEPELHGAASFLLLDPEPPGAASFALL
jgi:hypothetical protein